jgi:nucleotide-binding universal stress UspA family protein
MHEISWRKVCCPVDFSRESRAALEVALDLCRRLGAELTLLHVEEPDRADRAAENDAWLDDAARAGVSVRAAATPGDPKTAIAEWTAKHGFDVVVMGTHGWTGRAHALVGSVAESTLRLARCPVMVVHEEWVRARLLESAAAPASPPARP